MPIAVLLSGGVDSSVALARLRALGYRRLTAFYLKIWLEDELAHLGECPWEEDLRYCRAVCRQLEVPLEVLSLQSEYLEKVVHHALAELRAGRTPSPDIWCNARIKFGTFYQKIGSEFAGVASGHYARKGFDGRLYWLLRSPDPVKDQTYFLCHLSQAQLARALFPIGHLSKAQVRELAAGYGLPTSTRKDSQGICFLGQIRYPEFVRFHLGERTGPIVELESGRRLGEHRGYWFYTIGQRQGLGLSGGPWYVVKKDVDHNVIFVSHRRHLPERSCNRFVVAAPNWIARPPQSEQLLVKIRHGPRITPCRIRRLDNQRLEVTMAEEDPGIAPGQFAVFYQGERCLGGGVIEAPVAAEISA
ncbi:MAG: tRNA 2-thiouridine(34) synthase MnmA [Calditrichaeota bacterium]|nr:MAG: tRNA 2-thiouridine(34) synthase MnmA [Calditrichota bacterium]